MRKREYFDNKSLLVLELVRQNQGVLAIITGEVRVDTAIKSPASEFVSKRRSALNDLDDMPEGALVPDRLQLEDFAYKRNRMVSDDVVRKSKVLRVLRRGRLFMANGDRYIEAHHILSLRDYGADTVSNVIGLCPGHHQESHFRKRAVDLNQKLRLKVEGMK